MAWELRGEKVAPTAYELMRRLLTARAAFGLCESPWPIQPVRVEVDRGWGDRWVKVQLEPGEVTCTVSSASKGARQCLIAELPADVVAVCEAQLRFWTRENEALVSELERLADDPAVAHKWLVAWRPDEEKLAAAELARWLRLLQLDPHLAYPALRRSDAARQELSRALEGTRLHVKSSFYDVLELTLIYRSRARRCALDWLTAPAGHVIVATWVMVETSPRCALGIAAALAERAETLQRVLAEIAKPGAAEALDALAALRSGAR